MLLFSIEAAAAVDQPHQKVLMEANIHANREILKNQVQLIADHLVRVLTVVADRITRARTRIKTSLKFILNTPENNEK